MAGTIIFIASVADAASETLRVRVELPNDAESPAGQQVFVSFPPTQSDAEPEDDDEGLNRLAIGIGLSPTKGLHIAAEMDKMPETDETEPAGETEDAPADDVQNEEELSGELLPENEEVSNE